MNEEAFCKSINSIGHANQTSKQFVFLVHNIRQFNFSSRNCCALSKTLLIIRHPYNKFLISARALNQFQESQFEQKQHSADYIRQVPEQRACEHVCVCAPQAKKNTNCIVALAVDASRTASKKRLSGFSDNPRDSDAPARLCNKN
jgi:hypothetical protein